MKTVKPNYEKSNIGIPSSLLKYYGISSNYPSNKLLDKALACKPKNIVYIILDGMGVNIMKNHLEKDSFLNVFKVEELTTVYPSTTVCASTALHSCLSGYESSWIGWHMYFPKVGKSVELFSKKAYGTNETVDIENDIKYESIYEKIIFKNKSVQYSRVFPVKAGGDYENFDDMCRAVEKICKNKKSNLISFYYDEPDHLLHRNGTKSDVVKDKLKEIENKIKNLSEKVEDSLFIITADHGHTDVEKINLYKDKELIKCFSYPPTGEFRCAQFHILKEERENFKNIFNKNYSNDFILYDKKTFLNSGLLGYGNMHKNLNDFVGDFVAVATSNKSLLYITEDMKERNLLSDHAGLTEEEMIVPLIIISIKNKKINCF